MMNVLSAYRALSGKDKQCVDYIGRFGAHPGAPVASSAPAKGLSLEDAVRRGLKEETIQQTKALLSDMQPLDIINEKLIPALDLVGKGFEKGTVFLPQLLMSADAASASFEVLKMAMQASGTAQQKRGKVIIATVKGDIHDIGKNIVRVLLDNYGFEVLDLGKDVPPETIVETALREDVHLIGLSALMTTTVPAMEETIRQLRAATDCKVIVGGAVMTQEYADQIGADFYAPDAMTSVHYALEVLG